MHREEVQVVEIPSPLYFRENGVAFSYPLLP